MSKHYTHRQRKANLDTTYRVMKEIPEKEYEFILNKIMWETGCTKEKAVEYYNIVSALSE